MERDIELYENSAFSGFFRLDKIEEYFCKYAALAAEAANFIDWDEIILYAVYLYDNEYLVSADFMMLKMERSRYMKLCADISENCRMFFVKCKDPYRK